MSKVINTNGELQGNLSIEKRQDLMFSHVQYLLLVLKAGRMSYLKNKVQELKGAVCPPLIMRL